MLKPETIEKIRFLFQKRSTDGKNLRGKEINKFLADLGLCNELFFNDLFSYYPHLKGLPRISYRNNATFVEDQSQIQRKCLSYQDIIGLLDYLVSKKEQPKDKANKKSNKNQELLDSLKVFDRNGNGQINTNDLLPVLKKHLDLKEFQLYSNVITQCFGPTINYLQIFGQKNTSNVMLNNLVGKIL